VAQYPPVAVGLDESIDSSRLGFVLPKAFD
jgi:hypothetical protein